MTAAPVTQQVFRSADGVATITFPANMSRRCIEDLKAQIDLFIERLCWPNGGGRLSYLRGLAEMAARDAQPLEPGPN